jgi:DNA (cytosine-5)-methyltransferase 1
MTHGSLFSGIGGFDLAARWMGWDNVFHVERDPFCRQVLSHHFPESQSFDDVKTFDATHFRGRVSVISGGFPCQPFSAAGKRAGTSDDRYLWPEMFRIIREARPTYVVAENVRGLLSWNEGLVLDTVCADLEGDGYEVFPAVLPASGVNAPHRRDRIWIVATNTNSQVLEHRDREGTPCRPADAPQRIESPDGPRGWETFPTVAPVCGGDDGLPKRLDGITFPKWRRESIKAYGNAIVPQVALQIFRALEDIDRRTA